MSGANAPIATIEASSRRRLTRRAAGDGRPSAFAVMPAAGISRRNPEVAKRERTAIR